MDIKKSGARFSAIVGIGEKIKSLSEENGKEYLYLNRGINAVCNIDLSEVAAEIDYNSNEIQIYPANNGIKSFRDAINKEYFNNKTSSENIFITHGGMGALDLVFCTIDVDKVYIPSFYWGAYVNIMKVRDIDHDIYESLEYIEANINKFKNSAVIICDPNNPLGNKYDDKLLMGLIKKLNDVGAVVLIDCPYRRIFYDASDTFHQDLLEYKNVIILESFSKSVGLSGQRLAFVHCQNNDFFDEFRIRVLYNTNGVNAFAQVLVRDLLTTDAGKKSASNFKKKTAEDIRKNIQYLKDNNLLADEFYKNSIPVGIFVIVNKTEKELLDNYIGSVGLDFFTRNKEYGKIFSRICVSVPHEKFVKFFSKML
ncbi:pyridoxal phosphate-dependent aminotransferase [Bacteroidota bacterium]